LAISEHAISGVKELANTEREWADDLLSIFKALVGQPANHSP
jgi:hypothetical protein